MPMKSREVIGAAAPAAATAVPAQYQQSLQYMDRARRVLPRGAGSAARVARRPTPLAIRRASGAHLVDLDGNRYIDYVLALGPAFLGHSPPFVSEAVRGQLERGVLFGAQHVGEAELAERICAMVPSVERVAFANTGSDAVHAATRIARAATGRHRIVKFEGHYHGWIEPLHVNVPGVPPGEDSGPLPIVNATAGAPRSSEVIVCRWNDLAHLQQVLSVAGESVAMVIMEPVACNFGNFYADPGYLDGVRALCDAHGIVLAFDEVITGFRLAPGGAQQALGVSADLTIFAKALASGFPIAAVGGRDSVMSVASDGPLQHVGTYNGNAVSVAAANATLDHLDAAAATLYPEVNATAARLADEIERTAASLGLPLMVNRAGSVLQLFWSNETPVTSYPRAWACDPQPVADLALELLHRGVHALERGLWFVSTSHTQTDIDVTLDALNGALTQLARARDKTMTE
jgi:glutamate-1-semialdehyde 2,1-aminomutase